MEQEMYMIRGIFYRGMSHTTMPNKVKQVFFKMLGNKIGCNVTLQNSVRFDSENIEVSDGAVLNYGAQLITGGGSAKLLLEKIHKSDLELLFAQFRTRWGIQTKGQVSVSIKILSLEKAFGLEPTLQLSLVLPSPMAV